jgi:hypothetical protein
MTAIETGERPLEEAVLASSIIDAVEQPQHVRLVRDTLTAEFERVSQSPRHRALYGLLLARLSAKLPPGDPLRNSAAPFAAHFRAPDHLDVGPLFANRAICHQRHFFYNDEDGVESFQAFRAAYASDPAWTWEPHDTWVRLVGQGPRGRSIEIYANIPIAERTEVADSRIHRLSALLAEKAITPRVVVHRGHAFHVERTIAAINPSARLVFLGSCRGMDRIDGVMTIARGAQILATRGIGAQEINDPVLKALNDALLREPERLDWARFWDSMRAKLGRYALFSDYIPPNRNSPAVFLAAYYDNLVDGAE